MPSPIWIPILFLIAMICIPVAGANSGWQPVNITPWAQIDIPPGWTFGDITPDPQDPDTATLEAVSPFGDTRLVYVFEKDLNPASAGQLRRSQNQQMSTWGFSCCGDPLIIENTDQAAVKQIYYKGTDEGAVVCSAAYPGWGRYQYTLLMDGSSSVGNYFDDLPDAVAAHIRPIIPTNTSEQIEGKPES